jgi:DnaJ-class molecular chaperone
MNHLLRTSEDKRMTDQKEKRQVCSLCHGAGHVQNSVTKEIRVCWKCNAGGKVDKSLIPGRRWA